MLALRWIKENVKKDRESRHQRYMPLIIAGDLSCLRLSANIRCTHGSEARLGSHTIHLIVSSDTDVLAVHVDERSHEETSKGISSVPGRDWAGGLQETLTHTSQCKTTGWKRAGKVSLDNTKASESILESEWQRKCA